MLSPTESITETELLEIRNQFPVLSRLVNGKPLIYLDNGATTQKPSCVIDSIRDYYSRYNANIHRGVHQLSQEASVAYEHVRGVVQKFIGAESPETIVFTKGTTDGVNLVAQAFVHDRLGAGDEVLITTMEHHSNIVPWQQVCDARGAVLRVVPIDEDGSLDEAAFEQLLTAKTKFVAFTHVSNALGTINRAKELVAVAHKKNIPVLLDGAQAVPHIQVDVRDLDADFYVFSGHKIYGPTGIGVLYAKPEMIEQMSPYQGGGGIIKTVTFEKTTYVDGPLKFEAGTPNIEGTIALGRAIVFMQEIGVGRIAAHEQALLEYATMHLQQINGLRIIGTAAHKAAVISFVVEGIHPFDLGTILDQQGVAVRTGHHCTQPLMARFGVQGTVRVSFAVYNTKQEIDVLIQAIHKAIKMLS
ncbi:MAG: aminotransferase class V-fold PLP-dependent enzyme [Bacteroidia bacterium]